MQIQPFVPLSVPLPDIETPLDPATYPLPASWCYGCWVSLEFCGPSGLHRSLEPQTLTQAAARLAFQVTAEWPSLDRWGPGQIALAHATAAELRELAVVADQAACH